MTPTCRHRVNGVGQGGVKQDLSQIPWVNIRSRSLEIICFRRYKAYPERAEKVNLVKIRLNPSDPICVRSHLPSAKYSRNLICNDCSWDGTVCKEHISMLQVWMMLHPVLSLGHVLLFGAAAPWVVLMCFVVFMVNLRASACFC